MKQNKPKLYRLSEAEYANLTRKARFPRKNAKIVRKPLSALRRLSEAEYLAMWNGNPPVG